MIKRIKDFFSKRTSKESSREELEKKVDEGTKFAIKKYGDVFEALAKFDKTRTN